MTTFKFALGTEGRDTITGFAGKIIMRQEHINGDRKYCLAPNTTVNGPIRTSQWFEEDFIEPIGPTPEAAEAAAMPLM